MPDRLGTLPEPTLLRAASIASSYPSYDVFGYKVTPLTPQDHLDLFSQRIEAREPCVVTYLNLHGLHLLEREHEMRAFHGAPTTHVAIDGMPLIGLCKLAGIPVSRRHRVTNLDLIWPLLALAARSNWRVYYVGSTQAVLDRGLAVISAQLPNLQLRGHHGFVGLDCAELIADIADFDPNLVIVGMGSPLQERWILRNLDALPKGTAILAVGALLEYIAGVVKTPPRWMGRFGLEWLFRFLEHPKRFWRRYLIEPWAVAFTLALRIANRAASARS